MVGLFGNEFGWFSIHSKNFFVILADSNLSLCMTGRECDWAGAYIFLRMDILFPIQKGKH
jgi:hypothetical protein